MITDKKIQMQTSCSRQALKEALGSGTHHLSLRSTSMAALWMARTTALARGLIQIRRTKKPYGLLSTTPSRTCFYRLVQVTPLFCGTARSWTRQQTTQVLSRRSTKVILQIHLHAARGSLHSRTSLLLGIPNLS